MTSSEQTTIAPSCLRCGPDTCGCYTRFVGQPITMTIFTPNAITIPLHNAAQLILTLWTPIP